MVIAFTPSHYYMHACLVLIVWLNLMTHAHMSSKWVGNRCVTRDGADWSRQSWEVRDGSELALMYSHQIMMRSSNDHPMGAPVFFGLSQSIAPGWRIYKLIEHFWQVLMLSLTLCVQREREREREREGERGISLMSCYLIGAVNSMKHATLS
jgi:hypothetical protein